MYYTKQRRTRELRHYKCYKVATDTYEMYLRLRYRYMKGCIFVSFRYLDTDTIT